MLLIYIYIFLPIVYKKVEGQCFRLKIFLPWSMKQYFWGLRIFAFLWIFLRFEMWLKIKVDTMYLFYGFVFLLKYPVIIMYISESKSILFLNLLFIPLLPSMDRHKRQHIFCCRELFFWTVLTSMYILQLTATTRVWVCVYIYTHTIYVIWRVGGCVKMQFNFHRFLRW